ncbi:MAG: 2-hydroxy-3-oxopropionate reductase [SAR202 cluster bacterium]|jgi:2-hydroxy-3-oxopropionate reductase|nr:2-hydroxy-3-oxopropionate reductase [Dehalococcoidia bacterium]MQG47537.1 2-hydroxy-3-oxopropionate reductase [SAR202 cluster bacterium]
MSERIGFVGLGIMGKPMAINISKAGLPLTVFDRHSENVDDLVASGATAGNSPADVGEKSDIIITMVQNSPESEQAITGSGGILSGASRNNLVIDMSSIEPRVSQIIADKCTSKGVKFIDAPVSGGEPFAKSGDLAIMAGGNDDDFKRAKPIFEIVGKSSVLCGETGAGNVTKLANQIIVGANIHALSEAMVLGKKAGVNPETIYNAIKGGLAGSNVMNAKGPMMYERNFDPGFRIELHFKDINNAMATAKELNVPLQVTANLQQVLTSLVEMGDGKNDHSAILRYVERISGVEVSNS